MAERMGKLIGESNLSSPATGYAINLANLTLFLLAYTFGKTSPNNNSKKVTTITSRINFKMDEVTAANKFFPTNENKITTPMLMKLLATRSVAKSFLGFSKSSEMIFPFEAFPCKVSSMSFCDNENNATSAPETIAEQKSKANIPIKPNTRSVSIVYTKYKLGSGSKLQGIS